MADRARDDWPCEQINWADLRSNGTRTALVFGREYPNSVRPPDLLGWSDFTDAVHERDVAAIKKIIALAEQIQQEELS